VELVKGGKLTGEQALSVPALLAGVGGPGGLDLVLKMAGETKDASAQARLLAALEGTARQRGVKPAKEAKAIIGFLDGNDAVRSLAAKLVGLWGVAEGREKLLALAKDARVSAEVRRASLEGLASLGGKESVEALGTLAEKETDPEVRRQALVSL